MRVSGPLLNAQQAFAFWEKYVYPRIKPYLLSGHQLHLTVKPQTRSLEQNAHFHSLCDALAKSGHQWMGKPRSAAQWKVLLVSGHAMATNEPTEMTVGLEGEVINLRESTALMSVKRSSSLIEYCLAFCATNDIPTLAPEELPA